MELSVALLDMTEKLTNGPESFIVFLAKIHPNL